MVSGKTWDKLKLKIMKVLVRFLKLIAALLLIVAFVFEMLYWSIRWVANNKPIPEDSICLDEIWRMFDE